jgi:hypothetical protein
MTTVHRLRAVLGLQKKNFPDLLAQAKAIFNGLSGNATLFVTPNPSLATLQTRIQAFDEAQQMAGTRAKGAAAARNLKAGELITSLETARAYVQELADGSPEQAASLIECAGMTVGQVTAYSKPLLQATQSKPQSPVHVIANVGALTARTSGSVFFNWQYSDDGGKTWIPAPSTPQGHTYVAGLTPMVTYSFRVSVTNSKGPGAWSQVVARLVL